jgi:hypothetical protein
MTMAINYTDGKEYIDSHDARVWIAYGGVIVFRENLEFSGTDIYIEGGDMFMVTAPYHVVASDMGYYEKGEEE